LQKNNVEYIELPIAFDGLSVVVNPKNNSVDCLKVGELKKIWEPAAQGKVTNWNQIRSNFPVSHCSFMVLIPTLVPTIISLRQLWVKKVKAEATTRRANDNTVQSVSSDPNGLGYFGYAYYLETETSSSWLLLTVDMAASSLAGKRLQILAISPFLAQYSSMSRNLLLLAQSRGIY